MMLKSYNTGDVRAASQKLASLRSTLSEQGLDGFILATRDEHGSEVGASYSHRLCWLTGFTGTTASIAVLGERAAIFLDGRYRATARAEVDASAWSFVDVPASSPGLWLAEYAPDGAKIGYDARLHVPAVIRTIEREVAPRGIELVALAENPIDRIWGDQPDRPTTPAFILPIEYSGKSATEKLGDVTHWLNTTGAEACVLAALDSIAWLFNLRGDDIDIVPINYAFAMVRADGTADLFIDDAKLTAGVRQHLGNSVRTSPYDSFYEALQTFDGKTVSVDPARSNMAIHHALTHGGAIVREDRDPVAVPKAIKNAVEVEGFRQAHIRDGVALTRFLHWFETEAPKGDLTEMSAAARLNAFRRELPELHDLSFPPMSSADAHAAMPHYWPSEASDAPITPQSVFLCDSGGQYRDGTTDVTRTVAVGAASAEVKDRFTRVLKGHIAIATAVFPAGTPGNRIDALARLPLWAAGVDFAHGTGHGVGHFLCVHEGPAYIAKSQAGEFGIEAGMVLSNEPGYYKDGEYGIRIENLVVAVVANIPGAEMPMLALETLTMAPIDRKLIAMGLLTTADIEWVDRYHAEVFRQLGPRLPADARVWLEAQTDPLNRASENPLQEHP